MQKSHSQNTHTHILPCPLLWPHLESFTYPIVRNAIIVIIIVTSISNAILIVIFLPRVGKVGTVVLNNRQHSQTVRDYNQLI